MLEEVFHWSWVLSLKTLCSILGVPLASGLHMMTTNCSLDSNFKNVFSWPHTIFQWSGQQ